jgi:hypothetical protein
LDPGDHFTLFNTVCKNDICVNANAFIDDFFHFFLMSFNPSSRLQKSQATTTTREQSKTNFTIIVSKFSY